MAGSVVAGVLALGGLTLWAAMIDSNFRYGSGGVALPFALFWTAVWLVLCWAAAGILLAGFGARSRTGKITLWAGVVITAVGLAIWGIGLSISS